jgi:uncharacterized membrane protein HdeD (DUF308 family)
MANRSDGEARRRRRERILSLWWLWLPLGAALIVIGIIRGTNLLGYLRGGPVTIGTLILLWGIAGAWARFRDRG